MRKLGVALCFIVLGACSSAGGIASEKMVEEELGQVRTPQEFWIRASEMEMKRQGLSSFFGSYSQSDKVYMECVGDELVSMSPEYVTLKVETYIRSRLYADYKQVVVAGSRFFQDYKLLNGIEAPLVVQANCIEKTGGGMPPGNTYREMFTNTLTQVMHDLGYRREQSPRYFDCLVNTTMSTFTPEEIDELDAITVSKKNVIRMAKIISERDTRIGGDSDDYVIEKCKDLAGT